MTAPSQGGLQATGSCVHKQVFTSWLWGQGRHVQSNIPATFSLFSLEGVYLCSRGSGEYFAFLIYSFLLLLYCCSLFLLTWLEFSSWQKCNEKFTLVRALGKKKNIIFKRIS